MTSSRRPSIPTGSGGLIAALAAHENGDPGPLLLWHGEPREHLRSALTRWCDDPELADATMACIVSSAWRAGKLGHAIEDELPWISGTAAHHLAELSRARGRALAHAMRFASGMSEQSGLYAAAAEVKRN